MKTRNCIFAATALALIAGCAATSQRPVLYPNAYFKTVGEATAQADVDVCMQTAETAGLSRTNSEIMRRGTEGAAVAGAAAAVGTLIRGGSVLEGAATGAAVGGTAGATYGAMQSEANPAYRSFVQRCLQERGYDVFGWQ